MRVEAREYQTFINSKQQLFWTEGPYKRKQTSETWLLTSIGFTHRPQVVPFWDYLIGFSI